MKKTETENQLEEIIINILRDRYRVNKDINSETRWVIISDYEEVAKQIVKAIANNKVIKILNDL